jgi:hypothetical protein
MVLQYSVLEEPCCHTCTIRLVGILHQEELHIVAKQDAFCNMGVSFAVEAVEEVQAHPVAN